MKPETAMSEDSDEGGVELDPTRPPFVPGAAASSQANIIEDQVKVDAIIMVGSPVCLLVDTGP